MSEGSCSVVRVLSRWALYLAPVISLACAALMVTTRIRRDLLAVIIAVCGLVQILAVQRLEGRRTPGGESPDRHAAKVE